MKIPTLALGMFFALGLSLANAQGGGYRIVCSNMQPEESGNNDYDDHYADDVKNVHCTLRLRHAQLQYESTMLQ